MLYSFQVSIYRAPDASLAFGTIMFLLPLSERDLLMASIRLKKAVKINIRTEPKRVP